MACGYIGVDDIRAEGVTEDEASDALIASRIRVAASLLEMWTQRFFEPREMTVYLDGTGGRVQGVGDPIITVETLSVLTGNSTEPFYVSTFDDDEFVVYNRHLRQGLLNPDDRDDPKIAIDAVRTSPYNSLYRFPEGNQNVVLHGVFGYTDPAPGVIESNAVEPFALSDGMTLIISVNGGDDQTVVFNSINFVDITEASAVEVAAVISAGLSGARACATPSGAISIQSRLVRTNSSIEIVGGTAAGVFAFPPGPQGFPWGITPPLINRAIALLVIRDLATLGGEGSDDHDSDTSTFRVTEMRTRDQHVKFGQMANSNDHQFTGYFSGQPEIDNIISMYVRPPEMGWVGGRDRHTPILQRVGFSRFDPYSD